MTLTKFERKPDRYSCHNADWDLFRSTFIQKIHSVDTALFSVNETAESITRSLIQSADLSIPKANRWTNLSPPWWSRKLIVARRLLKSQARALRGSRNQQSRAEYNRTRNQYTLVLRKAKRESWRLFCTIGGHDIRGKLSKWLRKNEHSTVTPTCLTRPNGVVTSSLDETLDFMVNSLIPNDVDQATLPRIAEAPPYEHTPYTLEELN